jgi:glycolate oxidase FAD binding subunit
LPARAGNSPPEGISAKKTGSALRPRDEADLAEAVAGAAGPLRIRGGGTRPLGRPVAGTVLDVSRLSGITLYEPGALTLVAGAGTPLAELEAALAAEGQRLAFEPMDHRTLLGTEGVPTLGGVVAGNISGPRRVQAGACRDALIGVRFVDGSGTAIKNGGRVMKNVTGYDLVRLMAGSWGTLGVLTEIGVKLLPAPETRVCLTIEGLEDATALAALSLALGSPFEVSGAAHLQRGAAGRPVTMIRLEGFETQARYRAGRLCDLLGRYGAWTVEADPDRVIADWRRVADVAGLATRPGDVWRLAVKPSEAAAVVARAGPVEAQYDWGGGLVWLRVAAGTDLRAGLGGFPGHATLVRASAETRARIAPFPPENTVVARLSQQLRDRFDPRGILNAGLMAT